MKVAIINQPWEIVIPPVQAGSLAIWADKVVQRVKSDIDVIVYSRQAHQQQPEEWHQGILYCRVPIARDERILKGLRVVERLLRYPQPKRPVFASSLFYPSYIANVARDLQSRNCDVVHIFNFSQYVPVVRRLNPDVKIVLHMQCDWLTQLDRTMVEKRLRDVDLMIGCSDHVTEAVRKRFPMFADKCHTVFNGCDYAGTESAINSDTTQIERTEKRLLFVGRISPEKGVHVLLKAIPKIMEQCPDTILDIVGPAGSAPYEYMVLISDDDKVRSLSTYYNWLYQGEYQEQILKMIPAQYASRINFVGSVPHSQVSNFYRNSDIFVNPSLTDAFPHTLVEAMGSRKPVVVTSVGGMKEVVEQGKTGFLVESDNPEALADAIICLLKNEELCRSMGAEGQKLVRERLSWDRIAADLIRLYHLPLKNRQEYGAKIPQAMKNVPLLSLLAAGLNLLVDMM